MKYYYVESPLYLQEIGVYGHEIFDEDELETRKEILRQLQNLIPDYKFEFDPNMQSDWKTATIKDLEEYLENPLILRHEEYYSILGTIGATFGYSLWDAFECDLIYNYHYSDLLNSIRYGDDEE
jgi:hypothetical protein